MLSHYIPVDSYSLEESIHVAIHDAFVVKYDTGVPVPTASDISRAAHAAAITSSPAIAAGTGIADGHHTPPNRQTYLPLHCDQSSHSYTIALNSSAEYEGGGTYFPALGSVFRPGKP